MSAPPLTIYQAARIQYRIDAILDGSAARDRARQFEEDCRNARPDRAVDRARFKRLERWCQRRRAAALQTPSPAPPATSGPGWKILEPARASHEELERLVRGLFDLVFLGIPWPAGWRVRWGTLNRSLKLFEVTLACAITSQKLIIVDEAANRGRTTREFEHTLVHELTHVLHPDEEHGPGFTRTLARALHVLDELEAQPAPHVAAPAAIHPAKPHPEPPKGVRFRPGGFLDPEWEYRG